MIIGDINIVMNIKDKKGVMTGMVTEVRERDLNEGGITEERDGENIEREREEVEEGKAIGMKGHHRNRHHRNHKKVLHKL